MAQKERFSVGIVENIGISNGTVNVKEEDASGNVMRAQAATLPAKGTAGYAVGCEINKTGSGAGRYKNVGTTASCAFVLDSVTASTTAPFACIEMKTEACSTGASAQTIAMRAVTSDYVLGGLSTTDDDNYLEDMTVSADGTVSYEVNADPLAAHGATFGVFRQGGNAEWEIFAAGSDTVSVADAAAPHDNDITVTGALTTDKVLVTVTDGGTNSVTGAGAYVSAADTVTVYFSGDPSTDTAVNYVVLRRKGTFAPTHYVAAMGQYTSVAGDTTTVGPFTATGALTTDLLLIVHNASDDDDTITAASISAADAITLTVSADPVTDHTYTWAAVRAY